MRSPNAESRLARWAWALPAAALALAIGTSWMDPPALRGLRNATFDQFQRWHPRPYGDPPVRIVDIDDESLRRVGQWPWPRDQVARLLADIGSSQPAAVAVDVLFAERDGTAPGAGGAGGAAAPDADLARTLAQGKVVLGFGLTPRRTAPPPGADPDDDGLTLKAGYFPLGGDPVPFLPAFAGSVANLAELQQAAAGQGAMTFIPDVDGIVRQVPLVLSLDGRLVPSLTAEALRLAAGVGHYTVRSEGNNGGVIDVRIGERVIATDASGSFWVHYARPQPARYIPAWQVLDHSLPADALKGKVVLVGTSAQGLMDLRFSPLGGIIAGVEVHAQALEQVLSGRHLSRPGWTPALEWLAMLLGGTLVGVLAMKRSAAVSSAGFVALSGAMGGAAWAAFVHGQVLVDPVAPLLGMALVFIPTTVMRYLQSERRQRWMKQTFSRYVSPNLVDYLITHPDALVLEGRRQRCSFVFTDLAGFTKLMETMDPTTAVGLVNRYLDRMIAIAFEHDGTLDRIVGDAVAIMFSAPVEQTNHEQRALRCALQMHAFSRRYVDDLARRGIAFSETRIGVHTGEVTVGNFGGEAIFDYRALGDPVNTAARLEGANKYLGTLICVSEATLAGCPGAPARPIGRLRLAGRSSYLMAHEPLSQGTGGQPADVDYQHAFDLMSAGNDQALAAFEALSSARPHDPLVGLHVARLRAGKTGDAIDLLEK
ncbi:adenylate/guanylate cyclase domain-containing protein [Roseateles sp.]|uniref:CHASE2 domain-containing protein n=1 Tax=Roseateles sp. TaxID=1971397 RepID=UPI003264256D